MQKKLITSVSLPEIEAGEWRRNRKEIMQFAERFLRIKMRNKVRRDVTRTYNRRLGVKFVITTSRFTAAEYDTFHYIAAALRVSVSALIYGLIKLWQKPTRRAIRRFFWTNYSAETLKWDPEGGYIDENVTFWLVVDKTSPPPWEKIPLAVKAPTTAFAVTA
ncbi:MAG: hypothetical protein JSR44_11270 [Spirochaetes bacterium]|nr:hypothetical protein [Spirochaetota bacterium]